MPCIRCKNGIADITPWLCERCFNEVTLELALYFEFAIHGEKFEQELNGFRKGAIEKNIRSMKENKT